MFASERDNPNPPINYCLNDNLQIFVEIIYQQICQQLRILGCILVCQQNQAQNIIEAICLSPGLSQHRLNSHLLHNLKFNCCQLESVIQVDSSLSGYIYPVAKTDLHSRYLIFFSDRDLNLSSEQKQIIKTYSQLLQQYLRLEDKYRQQENDLQVLEDLFYQMGHQIRTPLTEISIMAETICLGSTKDFCQCQATAIKNKIKNLNLDLGNFIQLHKQAAIPKNTHDIKKILQESIDDFANLIKSKKIKINSPQATILLKIDRLKLKQIFDNLLSNAIYFSPEGESIEFYWQSFQEEILISICDRGCGLSTEDLQNMFLPFYSRRKDGQGLGLAIVKKILLDLKGNIWAENLPQGGTKISLVIPKTN